MLDLFGEKERREVINELQESYRKTLLFYEALRDFLLALKELHNPDVDRLFDEHQVEVREK